MRAPVAISASVRPMTAVIAAGAFGIIGVVLGGFLPASLQARRDRAERSRELRLAARVMFDELSWWLAGLELAIEENNVRHFGDGSEIAALWREHRSAFADVPIEQWHHIRVAAVFAANHPKAPPSLAGVAEPMGVDDEPMLADALSNTLRRATRARDELAKLMV